MFRVIIEKIKNLFKNKRFIVVLSIFFIVLSFLLFSNHGILKRINLEMEKNNIYKEAHLENQSGDSLKNLIDKLEKDTTEIERIARQSYGMVRPGEKVYFIKSSK